MANKKDGLMSVSEYAATVRSRRGFPVSVQYIYKLISQHKAGERSTLPFKYKEIGKGIWIVRTK